MKNLKRKEPAGKKIKAWIVLHDDHMSEIRFWSGEAVLSTQKEDLLSMVSEARGGAGRSINPKLALYEAEILITFPALPTPKPQKPKASKK